MSKPLLLSLLLLSAPLSAQESPWLDDLAKAKAVAKEKNRPILAYFTGSDWQKLCLQYQAECLEKKEFLDWAEQNVVLLMLDRPQNKPQTEAIKKQTTDLMAAFKIVGFPAIVILDAEGKERTRLQGRIDGGPPAFIREYNKALARAEGKPEPGSKEEAAAKEEKKEEEKKYVYVPKEENKKHWSTSYAGALEKAKKEKKIVLASFTVSDPHEACQMLKGEVLDQEEFVKWAEKNVVLLEVDCSKGEAVPAELKAQNEKLQTQFKVSGVPTVVFVDAAGKSLGSLPGFRVGTKVADWIKDAQKYVAKAKR
jgi:protein disulfide-isomerase